MRKLFALSYAILISGFACIAHAQLSQTGAGGKAGGGAFVPCAGTAVHLTSPNNLTTSSWLLSGLTGTFTATDPNVLVNNATDLTSTVGGGAFNSNVIGQVANTFTLLAATGTYAFGAYFKSVVAPSWNRYYIFDGGSNYFGAWFNVATATPAVGNTFSGGTGLETCANVGAAGNGYTQISIAGHVTSDTSSMFARIDLVDGNGTGVTTAGQEIYAWQVSP